MCISSTAVRKEEHDMGEETSTVIFTGENGDGE